MRRAAIQGPGSRKANAAARRPKTRGAAAERQLNFAELPTYVGYQVRRAQAAIFGQFETTLADFDLTPGSFGVLTLIKANPGITQVALATAFGVDKSTMIWVERLILPGWTRLGQRSAVFHKSKSGPV